MELNITCNIINCRAELPEEIVVTSCSHAFCPDCAHQYGLLGPGPFPCPICQKPLNESKIRRQAVHPSDEWRSTVLCGIHPTSIMECAGRALGFWSYQLATQVRLHATMAKNSQYNYEVLQAELESVISEANTHITALTTRIQEMELQEQNLRRMNDDLRSREEQTAEKLAVTNQLYQKLKHKYTQVSSPTISQSLPSPNFQRNANPLLNPDQYGQHQPDSHYHRGPELENTERASYFPATSGSYSRTHVAPVALGGMNHPMVAQYKTDRPSHRLPAATPRVSGHSLAPDAVPSTSRSSSRFHHPASNLAQRHGPSKLGRITETSERTLRGQIDHGMLGSQPRRSGLNPRMDSIPSQLNARPPSRTSVGLHSSLRRS